MKKAILLSSAILLLIAGLGYYQHHNFYAIPGARLGLQESYPDMKADSFHYYINLPVDYKDPQKGLFRGFYILSPNFRHGQNITFLLTDGQMELVTPGMDFSFFESVLPGSSYVVIGVRGQSPTLFPEVYRNDTVDHAAAMNLYGSDQQIEDIESVRIDLVKRGILGRQDKINIFGASGAGFLAQQYISKYGAGVNRVILESTGAPDIAIRMHMKYSPDFKDFNPQAALILDSLIQQNEVDKKSICNILYQIGRMKPSPVAAQLKIVEGLRHGESLWSIKFKPVMNLSILNYVIQSPQEVAARVRWFELVGYDLLRYNNREATNLLYEISESAISDMVAYHKREHKPAREFVIDRRFQGEVLILKGRQDVVFSDRLSIALRNAYPHAKLLFFEDGHRLQGNIQYYQAIRKTFFEYGFGSGKSYPEEEKGD